MREDYNIIVPNMKLIKLNLKVPHKIFNYRLFAENYPDILLPIPVTIGSNLRKSFLKIVAVTYVSNS